ncbi:chemotaxis protein CheA [Clostridium paridis]|uniref:Chemotaxis protein CheA n=1 Tax=Clostridium paridis TaxID=2803863 RepID=A0A937FGE6_9CLOT|nr:chemotaxis protein CheA [Clostridium paridis]MBL4933470.1 chemotaxis protein CheA [Clostridium paridis]
MSFNSNDQMLELFIHETSEQLEKLEQSIIDVEATGGYTSETINEIFRIMHTIKGSSAMMLFNNISTIAHSIEDLFYFIREKNPKNIDDSSLCDVVLEGLDFIKIEIEKIKNGDSPNGDEKVLKEKIKKYLEKLKIENNVIETVEKKKEEVKQYYVGPSKSIKTTKNNTFQVIVHFQEGCEMENIRAFAIVHNLKEITEELKYIPEDITDNDDSVELIKENGFRIEFKTDKSYKDIEHLFMEVAFIDKLDIKQLEVKEESKDSDDNKDQKETIGNETPQDKLANSNKGSQGKSLISVNVEKLDNLMDLVGEIVIAEAMVTENPDLKGLTLDNFNKAARQLKKITSELQDMVMSIRMVPIAPTFFKMNRIVRDMSKKLKKEVTLKLIGEDTEVDKNIIEHIGDPLMHIIRNSIDHGIEDTEERASRSKSLIGTVTLEAKNAGSEVLIIIKDDGKGLNKEKILKKAAENGILNKAPEEMTDKEIYNLIFLPGFSTKEAVTEFSGRGVGMDVVIKSIEKIGGSIQVDSKPGIGTTMVLKIPLTLAIIDGINIRVGKSIYTVPTTSIQESFRPKEDEIFRDTEGNEMIMIRGKCYSILRLHEIYNVKSATKLIHEGILVMIEDEIHPVCLLADELIGEQQVVVKALPSYITKINNIKGISGCTLLGDGSISLILDISALID